MNKPVHPAREAACQIRFGQVGLAQLRIRTTDPDALLSELTARIAAAPQLFERAGICLDLSTLEGQAEANEVGAVLDVVRSVGLLPVGLTGAGVATDALARALELPVITPTRAAVKAAPEAQATSSDRPPVRPAAPSTPAPEAPESWPSALMHHQLVRSGQRIYARNRDLVVTAAVGAGAEVMADGCVHVYGSLRGRALAGARGDLSARVFCHEFHAELVSIAGVFRVFETIPADLVGKPVQGWLDGDDLKFARFGGP
jgi:septum site-determining protein MinC